MRRVFLATFILTLLLCSALCATRAIGQIVPYPLDFSHKLPLPTESALFARLLPIKVGDFSRQQPSELLHSVQEAYLIARGSAVYARPGDPNNIYIELRLYNTAKVAARLINPDDWRLHSRIQEKYVLRSNPIPFVFTMTHNGYQNYALEYVSGNWNVSIQSVNNLSGLLSFADAYPY